MVSFLRNLKFKTRIIGGLSIILMLSIISSLIAIMQLVSISKQTDLIYEHPYKVSNAVRDINTELNSIHVSVNNLIGESDTIEINNIETDIKNSRVKLEEAIAVIKSKYLGKKKTIKDLEDNFKDSYKYAMIAVKLRKDKQHAKSFIVITVNFPLAKKRLLKINKLITDFAENKANSLHNIVEEKKNKSIKHISIVLGVLFLLILAIAIFIIHNISIPIKNFISKSRNIIIKETGSDKTIKKLSDEKLLKYIDRELSRMYIENKSILKATMDNSHAGIALIDAQSAKIKYVNKTGRLIGGNSNIELQNALNNYKSISDWNIYSLHGKHYSYEELPHFRCVKEGISISDEIIIRINGDDDKYLWVNSAPVYNDKKEIISGVVVFLDITKQKLTLKELLKQNKRYSALTNEYKKQNQELINAKQKAEEINRLKSSFMATMSHELRTPLNTVIGLSNIINTEMEKDEIIEMNQLINKNGNQLLDIIESIFSLTLLQAGEYKVNNEIFFITDLISEFQYYIRMELIERKKNHIKTIFCRSKENNNINIRTDKTKLRELLKHLIINAIKFTEEGEIECDYIIDNKDIIFTVKDTGPGIEENLMNVIFEKFRQADSSNTRKFGGIGLGLATCKEIADVLGGDITVESEKNVGSTFLFRLKDAVI